MGKLLRRTADGDELLAEWSMSDQPSVDAARRIYDDWLARDYQAVSSDGTTYAPLAQDEFPAAAEQVILSTGMGGG